MSNAWTQFDPTASWSKTNKALKIDMGMFETDQNYSTFHQIMQVNSRLSWESGQVSLGKAISHIRNIFGYVDEVEYFNGATIVSDIDSQSESGWGFTLGAYINTKTLSKIDNPATNSLIRHEYGHTIQSSLYGPLFLSEIGLPSVLGCAIFDADAHSQEWYETQEIELLIIILKKMKKMLYH